MVKVLFFSYLFSLYCLSYISAEENTKLLFVQIMFRHGDRAPIDLYPNDPNPESFWTEGLGKLTMLGRKQHYALGKFLRQFYGNFTSSSPNEVSVMSSECDRCMKSAESNLASFFAPSSEWQIEKDLRWQPISVYYTPKDEDKWLETDSYCPRAVAEQVRVLKSPEGQAFIAKHKEMFENLTVNSGSPITNWTNACYLHDVLFIEKRYNLTIPAWAIPYWEELESVAHSSFYWSFNSPLLHRLRSGPLLKKIIEMMESKLSGDIPLQKIQIYSAHDTNIAAMLNALQLFNMRQPPYCATLLFELHEKAGERAVRLLYLNSTHPESDPAQTPHPLVLRGCAEFCPLAQFVNLTRHLMPGDWEKECQLDRSFVETLNDKNIRIVVIFSALAFLIAAISIFATWKLYAKNRDRYSYHLMPLN